MDFSALIKKRRSIRNYTTTKPGWKNVLEAIDAANQGPFAGNHNNLMFLIIENKETIQKISQICEQEWVGNSKILVIVCSDDVLLERLYGERGRVYSRQQAGAAILTFQLKLEELGMASCWVGAYEDKEIRSLIKSPERIQIEAVIPVGYAREIPKRKNKKSLENSLFWEKWDLRRRPTAFEEPMEELPREKVKY